MQNIHWNSDSERSETNWLSFLDLAFILHRKKKVPWDPEGPLGSNPKDEREERA
ncbi:hypothetical protein LEP1GSC192_1293 [Leptospira sp. B5-022]|nr:hypothetical protein LEP1GSC192_1293 [Leptospira sp. B5-022]